MPSTPTASVNYSGSAPSFSVSMNTSAKATNSTTVTLATPAASPSACRSAATRVFPRTPRCGHHNSTTVTLSNPVSVAKNTSLTFSYNLSSGIVQHTEEVPLAARSRFMCPSHVGGDGCHFHSLLAGQRYLDIEVVARATASNSSAGCLLQRNREPGACLARILRVNPAHADELLHFVASAANRIASRRHSHDGSAPEFDALLKAMKNAVANDPSLARPGHELAVHDQCTRMAYDIVWSQQTALPRRRSTRVALHQPPNPGGSASSSSSGGTNGLETDGRSSKARSTVFTPRRRNAQRLTKFVAAASAAIFCEATSLNSPSRCSVSRRSTTSFAASVESELMVEGSVSRGRRQSARCPCGLLLCDWRHTRQSTTASQRFQIATGDTLSGCCSCLTRPNRGSDSTSEAFYNTGLGLGPITPFQAARGFQRLAYPQLPIARRPLSLAEPRWPSSFKTAQAARPASDPPPNPPLTCENTDFNIGRNRSTRRAARLPLSDLDALTQGYVIRRPPRRQAWPLPPAIH